MFKFVGKRRGALSYDFSWLLSRYQENMRIWKGRDRGIASLKVSRRTMEIWKGEAKMGESELCDELGINIDK